MRSWPLFLLLGSFACAKGVTSGGPVDDDDGVGVGGSATGGTASIGGTANTGGTAGQGAVGTGGTGAVMGNPVWINEIHYDNESGDINEGIEVVGVAGVDLTQYELELYNGAASYNVLTLSGSIPDQANGFGAVWVPVDGMQNGPSDGIALIVSQTSEVLLFLGYEGSATAADGKAAGSTSIDVGVAETGTTPAGQSLQLTGTGNGYTSFTWSGPATASPGQLNAGQTVQ